MGLNVLRVELGMGMGVGLGLGAGLALMKRRGNDDRDVSRSSLTQTPNANGKGWSCCELSSVLEAGDDAGAVDYDCGQGVRFQHAPLSIACEYGVEGEAGWRGG